MRNTMLSGTAALALAALLSVAPGLASADTTTNTTDTKTTTEAQSDGAATTTGTEVKTEAEADAQDAIDAAGLMGDTVENSAGEDLGDIETLVVADDGSIEHVVIGVGGFLGIGEKEVALPWDRFTVVPGENKLVADVSREELEAMPEFDWPENYQEGSLVTADRTDTDMDGDAVDDAQQSASQAVDNATQTAEQAADDADETVDQAINDDDADKVDDAGQTLPPSSEVLAGSLIGAMILSHDDRDVGEVDDVVIGADGTAEGVIVDVGGFLGVNDKQVMIAWKDLEVRRNEDGDVLVRTGLTEEAMGAMSDYDVEAARSGTADGATTTNQ